MDSYNRRDNHYGGNSDYQNRFVPVKVGEELTVTVEAVGEKGDGLAKVKGFVIFVPGGKEGQTVKVRISRVLRKVAFAEIIGEASAAPEDAPAEDEEDCDPETGVCHPPLADKKSADDEGEEEF